MASAQELLQEQSDLPAAQPGEGPKKKGRIKFPKLKKKPPVKRLIALALAAGRFIGCFSARRAEKRTSRPAIPPRR